MKIDKDQVMELLRSRGEHDKADRVGSELPGTVDTDRHADLLGKLGVDPSEMLGRMPGGLGGLGGGLAG